MQPGLPFCVYGQVLGFGVSGADLALFKHINREIPNRSRGCFEKHRFRAKREQLTTFHGLFPESRGQNRALTVLYVPYSLDSGPTTAGLTTTSIQKYCFLKLIILEHKPLLAYFGFATRQKWLDSRRMHSRKQPFYIDVGGEGGRTILKLTVWVGSRRARISGSKTFVLINSRLESNKEETKKV